MAGLTRKTYLALMVSGALLATACGDTSSQPAGTANSVMDKDPCDDPDAAISCCFANAPNTLTFTLDISGANEPGVPLVVTGTLLRADGRTPYAGVLMYVYQTDHTGHYTKQGGETGVQKWHGHLHGWGQSDRQGHYEIHTVRPAPYPNDSIPAHMHVAIQEPGGQSPYYISDFVFADDPLVTPQYLASIPAMGGTGVVALKQAATGGWVGRRNMVLKN